MRILFIAGTCPYPPDSGAPVRTYNLLRRLCCRHEITLVTPSPTLSRFDLHAAFGKRMKKIITVPTPRSNSRISRAFNMVGSLFSPLPYIVYTHRNPCLDSAVISALSDADYDLLHCDSISVVPSVPIDANMPKFFTAHNVEAVIWERYVREEKRPYMRAMLASQMRRVASFEASLPDLFDCCAAVSELDETELRKRYRIKNTCLVRNGVDTEYYTPSPDPDGRRIAFIGSLDWRPNQDAIRYLIERILPHIRSELPEIEVSIVGRRPPRSIVELCGKAGVSLFADVPDVRPHLAASSVVIVPLRIGGGSRLKILEAMAAGRCVVSTAIGAEGLDLTNGKNILIADNPSEFASHVVSALRNPSLRAAIASSGRSLVENAYNWDTISRDLEHAWLSVCNNFRNPMTLRL